MNKIKQAKLLSLYESLLQPSNFHNIRNSEQSDANFVLSNKKESSYLELESSNHPKMPNENIRCYSSTVHQLSSGKCMAQIQNSNIDKVKNINRLLQYSSIFQSSPTANKTTNINFFEAKKAEISKNHASQLLFENSGQILHKESSIIKDEDFLDRAKGSILGAFVGDSVGSYLEFKNIVTSKDIDEALTMPGGGPFLLSPGQITDDSELAICLLYGLLDGKGIFSLDKIAYYYFKWITSPPFDIGNTCRNGLKPLLKYKHEIDPDCKGWSSQCIQAAKDANKNSTSNGGLMRITPLAVWCSKLEDIKQIEDTICLEQSFTHPNTLSHQAAFTYCLAIRSLLRNAGNFELAINEVGKWIYEKGGDEIKEWWDVVENDIWISEKENIGWSKIAWTYSFILLKNETDYNKIMRKVLMNGGDTDTNACIVGGLIGAKLGYKKLNDQIPENCKKLLEYDAPQAKRKRPGFLTPRNAFLKIEELVNIAPSHL